MPSASRHFRFTRRLIWLLPLVVSLMLAALFIPQFGKVRHGPGIHDCYRNMGVVAKAILAYRDEHGHYPPPFVRDSGGRPAHSWRVLILPYLGHAELYDRYRFDEPWDSVHNSQLAEQMPLVYRCPDDRRSADDRTTSYLAIVGDQTMWPSDDERTLQEITDEPFETILLIESTDDRVHWMAPADLLVEEVLSGERGPSSRHRGGVWVVSYADRHTEVVEHMPREMLCGMLSVDGGEAIDASLIETR